MTGAAPLLFATLAVPLAMLVACLAQREGAYAGAIGAGAGACPGGSTAGSRRYRAGAARAAVSHDTGARPAGGNAARAAALLWILAGAYASADLRGDPNAGRFAEWWRLTLTGSLGVFIAADLVTFYLTYSVVSLAAWGLIVHDGTTVGRRAGIIYAALAVLGEAFLLMAFVFMATATSDGSLLIRDAVAALPTSPWRSAAMALLIPGFGLKVGLVPGHVWTPLAYTAAPLPAAAALSGAAVKAGVIGFIRFRPLGAAMPQWGEAMAAVGLFSGFYGVLVGITQENPKTVLAYSSISQMGLLSAALGMGLAAGDSSIVLGTSFSAAHHVLVKGGLFLAIGAATAGGARLWRVLVPAAVLALGLGGLPLTGGALAKLAVKVQFGESVVGTLAALLAAGSTLLMIHFLRRLAQTPPRGSAAPPTGYTGPWLISAVMAVAVPWALFLATGNGSSFQLLSPGPFWSALWPVMIGGVLALGLWWWTERLPRVPAGDIVVAAEAAIHSVVPWGGDRAG